MAKKEEGKLTPSRARRNRLRRTLFKEEGNMDVLQSMRIIEDIDPFESIYDEFGLLHPPYRFSSLYDIYEESDLLQECVDAMQKNVDGFGYQLLFRGNDVSEKDTPEAIRQKKKLENFYDRANGTQSMATVRKRMREDYEVIGNGALEYVRNLKGEIMLVNYMPFTYVRLSAVDKRGVTVTENIPRDGKVYPIRVKKYFRKFCQMSATGGSKLRWFKEFGDPRYLDATTGEFKRTRKECKMVASELFHFKHSVGGSAYGLPRWIGVVLDVLGRRSGQYVNYDMFESQGIPPLAVLISGGKLTDDTYDEIEALIRGMRGVEKWNRIAIIESELDSTGLEDKGVPRLELKNLAEYRKDDLMFKNYLQGTEECIRHAYRLPSLYVGLDESFTHATAKAAKLVAEEQVFVPERQDFDEVQNVQMVQNELKVDLWYYKSKGPKIVGAEEMSTGVSSFSQAGALTINHAIGMANEAFGLQMSEFKEPWAKYPIPIVLKLLETAKLKGVEEIAGEVRPPLPALKQQLIPFVRDKVLKTDLFSDEEKDMYKRMIALQIALFGGEDYAEDPDFQL